MDTPSDLRERITIRDSDRIAFDQVSKPMLNIGYAKGQVRRPSFKLGRSAANHRVDRVSGPAAACVQLGIAHD